MMQYVIERNDGTVAVMTMLPIAVLTEDGERHPAERIVNGRLVANGGGVVIDLPAEIQDLETDSVKGVALEFPSPDGEVAKWHPDERAKVKRQARITSDKIPSDRTYRDAWVFDGSGIVHDMGRAREFHRNMIRAARAPLLASLDVEYQKADERGDAPGKSAVANAKQSLRDATKDARIDAATSPEALKLAWPESLGKSPF